MTSHHRLSAPSPIPIPARLYPHSSSSPFPSTPSSVSTPSKRRRPQYHSSFSSSSAAATSLLLLLSLRSLYSLLPFVRSSPASNSLFPFSFLVSLLSFALSLLLPPFPESLKSLLRLPSSPFPLRSLAAKSALLTLTLLLRFHALRYCPAGAAILADLAGALLAKSLSGHRPRAPAPRRRIFGFAALATAVALLSYSWDRIGCFPISSSPPPTEGCARIAPMLLPLLSGFLGFYERASSNWGSLKQLGRRRVRLLSLGFTTAMLFVPACISFLFVDSGDGSAVSIGALGWPLINTVVFGVVLGENYGDDKLLFSAKDFRRDFLLTFFCTLVLELFYFPRLSLPGFLFCGFLLWIGVKELGSSSLSYVELGSSDNSESLSSMIMKPIRHILSERKSRKIALFLLINTGYMVVEFVAGFMSNSLGLISDACHMLFDCAALAIGLYASYISRLPANSQFNYGRGRFEVLSGYVNAVFLVLVGALIVLESLERILEPQEISTSSLLAVSIGGLLVNVSGESSDNDMSLSDSHKHQHIDHNMEGIFLHVLADTMGSVGVVISTLLIKYKGWTVADPACSIFISIMIVSSVLPLLRNSAEILLQRVPRAREHDLRLAVDKIVRIKGVQGIQNMHVWNFTNTDIIGTMHLHVSAETDKISAANSSSKLLHEAGIRDLTIQVECVKG
ncbi:hypothetical protein BHE74_00042721 [Ensete ventricosum]|nr:hypothetical protein BHE74_00042721 [Ensete ventricosum]